MSRPGLQSGGRLRRPLWLLSGRLSAALAQVADRLQPADVTRRGGSVETELASAVDNLAEAQLELGRRQSFTDALLETIEVGIVSCDADGVFIVSNRAEREMFGLETGLDGLVPAQLAALIDVFDDQARALEVEEYPLMRTLRGEIVTPADVRVGPPGGPYREVVVRANRITGPQGEVLGAVAALTDVTAERTASRALADERRKLTEAQRLGQLGSFEHDFGTKSWTYSEQMCALWGVEPGGMSVALLESLVVDEDRESAIGSWDAACLVGGHSSQDYRIRRAGDGAERHIRSRIEIRLGADGQPVHGRGTHLDITELSAAQDEAQRANAFLNAVLSATPDYTFVTDLATSATIYVSREQDALGITSEQLAGLGPVASTAVIHADDEPRLRALNIAAADLEDGQVLQVRYRGMHADGDWRWLNRRVTPFRRNSGGDVLEILGVIRDVTDVVDAEDRLTHATLHDDLTGLPNRALLVDRLDSALVRSERDGREVAVLFCDLDGFKNVNDSAGHAAGDAVLLEIAHRFNRVLREGDTVARVGGDEFVIVVEPWSRDLTGTAIVPAPGTEPYRALAISMAERVAAALRAPVTVNGVDHVVSASIGITYARRSPGEGGAKVTADEVLQDADVAMYRAKELGKDRYELFEHGPLTDTVRA